VAAAAAETAASGPVTVGSRVVLSPTYASEGDASGGPLKLGDVGTVLVDDNSDKPLQILSSAGTKWWYTRGALVHAPSVVGDMACPLDSSTDLLLFRVLFFLCDLFQAVIKFCLWCFT
jgi:hypothetical protein